jgi:hypothetical protein
LDVDKPLFVVAGAAMSLVFVCSTNLDSHIKILNLDKMSERIESSFELKPNSLGEALLDSATGDLYFYNAIKLKWVPKYNIG